MDIFGNFSKLNGDRDRRKVSRKKELDFSYSDVMSDPIAKIESKETINSFSLLKAIIVLVFCILLFKVFTLQVINGKANESLAEGNRIRPRVIEADRGLINDVNGQWLARNKPDFTLSVYPSDLPKKKSDREEIYQKIADLAQIGADEAKTEIEKNGVSSLDAVVVRDNISHDDALLLEEKIVGLPGVFVGKQSMREYLLLPGLAHILGYTGKVGEADIKDRIGYYLSDRIGKTGLEYQYEDSLKGANGVEQIEVNSKGTITRVLVKNENKEPISGSNLTLYLDKNFQDKTASALLNGINSARELTGDSELNSGVAMVMDVNTGGILACVSLPDYNNNLFATKISDADYKKLIEDKSNPMFNRAIKGMYPPGSISKIILAVAGLMEGTISTRLSFDTPAAITIGDYTFPDWKDHGITDIKRAIAESNNIFFYGIGGGFEDRIGGLGIMKIKKWWQSFGLGEKTGVDLPSESNGLLPDPDWKKAEKNEPWYLGDTYHVSIGQGDLLVTPIQMLRAVSVIANGGKLLHPQFVKNITDSKGNITKNFGPSIEKENFISADVLKIVAEGMRLTITEGSAKNLNDLPVSLAGKTGTAQFMNNEKTHAWFTAYAPYEKPEIAVIVLVDGGGGGHEIAAPIAKEIINYYFTR